MASFTGFFRSLSKKDFREIISFIIITTVFAFMFMVVLLPIWFKFPDTSQRFADIILGYLFGNVLQKVMGHYFPTKGEKTEKTDKTDKTETVKVTNPDSGNTESSTINKTES